MQIRTAVGLLLASEGTANVVTAKLHWREVVRPEGYDANDESSAAGRTVTARELEFRTFFHQVEHRLSGFQRFLEVETGDVMLDYAADLELAGKADCRIEVDKKFYVQKNASAGLLEAWDVVMEGGGLLKSLLLAPAP